MCKLQITLAQALFICNIDNKINYFRLKKKFKELVLNLLANLGTQMSLPFTLNAHCSFHCSIALKIRIFTNQ